MFQPTVWPEDPPPAEAVHCRKCELACQRSRVVWGEGNPDAPIWIILDNPGEREDREGNPYVCGTRQTLQYASYEAGFAQNDLYVTYVLKCRPRRKYDKPKARAICMQHMKEQEMAKKPQLALCLGNVAAQSYLENPDADVRTLRGTWTEVRGVPTTVSYHPLAVRRRPNLMPYFLEDWRRVAAYYGRG